MARQTNITNVATGGGIDWGAVLVACLVIAVVFTLGTLAVVGMVLVSIITVAAIVSMVLSVSAVLGMCLAAWAMVQLNRYHARCGAALRLIAAQHPDYLQAGPLSGREALELVRAHHPRAMPATPLPLPRRKQPQRGPYVGS
jgi:hypothetical protein